MSLKIAGTEGRTNLQQDLWRKSVLLGQAVENRAQERMIAGPSLQKISDGWQARKKQEAFC